MKEKQNVLQRWFRKESFTYFSQQSEDELKEDLKKNNRFLLNFFANFEIHYYKEENIFILRKAAVNLTVRIYTENNKTYIELSSWPKLITAIGVLFGIVSMSFILFINPTLPGLLIALGIASFIALLSTTGYFLGKAIKTRVRANFAKQFKLIAVTGETNY